MATSRLLMQIKIRLLNPAPENDLAVVLLAGVFEILDDSGNRPARGTSQLTLRYLTVSPRADVLTEDGTPRAFPDAAPTLPAGDRRQLPPAPRSRR